MTTTDPIFILSPGRSFSSVVCAMIGSHPELYALPEVNLFHLDALDGSGRQVPEHGIRRVIAQLHSGCQTEEAVEEAIGWIRARSNWETPEIFRYIVSQVTPKRCVDKSPTNIRAHALRKIWETFPQSHFLHLARHPRSACQSRVNAFKRKTLMSVVPPEDHERSWYRSNKAILKFAARIPRDRYMYLKGEDLLRESDKYLTQIAEWLGIDQRAAAIEAMKHPERSPYSCPGPANARGGNNRGFLMSPELKPPKFEPASLDGSLEWMPDGSEFSAETREMAALLGYE